MNLRQREAKPHKVPKANVERVKGTQRHSKKQKGEESPLFDDSMPNLTNESHLIKTLVNNRTNQVLNNPHYHNQVSKSSIKKSYNHLESSGYNKKRHQKL